jgi:hypothetical protein
MLQLILRCHNNAFVFSQAKYCDTHFIYISCNGNVHATVEEYQRCFPDSRIPSKGVFSCDHQCLKLVVFQVSVCSLTEKWYLILTYKRTFLRWFREAHDHPLVELPLSSACHIFRCGKLYIKKRYTLITICRFNILNRETLHKVRVCANE